MDPDEYTTAKRRDSSHLCTESEESGITFTSTETTSDRIINVKLNDIDEESDDEVFYSWAKENFMIPECQYFIPDGGSKRNDVCKCGIPKSAHRKILDEFSEETKWSAKECCRLVPTTSFGTLNFVNEDSVIMPKFIRVGTTITEPNPEYIIPEGDLVPIKNLLLKHWKMEAPGLLISVIGECGAALPLP